MAHALAEFIRQQMDERELRNRDVVEASKLSRALVSKYVTDDRDQLGRLPERDTLAGLAKAFNVTTEFLLGKAVESLGLGYSSGDFINSVRTASSTELLEEIGRRLDERGEGHAGPPATKPPEPGPADQPGAPRILREVSPFEVDVAARNDPKTSDRSADPDVGGPS